MIKSLLGIQSSNFPPERSKFPLYWYLLAGTTPGGWTLIELAAVSIIAGILAAIAGPSLYGLKLKQDFKTDTQALINYLRENQSYSLKQSKKCELTLSSNQIDSSCLPSFTFDNGSQINLLNFSPNLTFSYKGTVSSSTFLADPSYILVSNPKTSGTRCLALTLLGLIRSGDYVSPICQSTL